MNTGFFMLFPLLTVHLTRDLGFDATGVGLVLAARNLLQQGSAPLGGSLADRVGYKPVGSGCLARPSGRRMGLVELGLITTMAAVRAATDAHLRTGAADEKPRNG